MFSFAADFTRYVLKGGPRFYAWMGSLTVLMAGMLGVFYLQNTDGLIVTGLTSQIHDGLYLANLVFLVGVAAGAVTIVFPAYVYHHEGMHKVTVLGEMLAISAVVMVMLFVFAHMGRPERLWHMIPPFGIYSFSSMLGWDVLVLNGYLFLNAVVGFWFLYAKYTGKPLNKKVFLPLVYVSIVWALSIHTVTAFLLATNPSRPMWFHSMMPIRFIATAFAAGPALIILAFLVIRKNTKFWIDDSAIQLLATIVTWCLGIAIFLTLSEIVVELYARTEHANGLYYLMFGLHGLTSLVPWFWSSVVLMVAAFVLFLLPATRRHTTRLAVACAMAFTGIWIEKGMGLIVPGFIPSPIGEVTEYFPTLAEWLMVAGIWACGFFLLTILLKGAIGVLLGEVRRQAAPVLGVLVLLLACGAGMPLPAMAQAAAAAAPAASAPEVVCFESRKGAGDVTQRDIQPGLKNVRCSPTTGAALWYGDPLDGTVPMGKMPLVDDRHAVVKPRSARLNLLAQCGTACHNGVYPKGFPTSKQPTPIPTMEAMLPELKDFQHGRGRIWCLDCHHSTQRAKLVDHFGDPVSFDQPQLLCGKCHGDKLRDWRDGIHGKRIGSFVSTGTKRWFTCTECHGPHNVQDGARNKGFVQLQPELPPQLPRGMKDAAHEKKHPIAH